MFKKLKLAFFPERREAEEKPPSHASAAKKEPPKASYVDQACQEWLNNGCSPEAANLIMTAFSRGDISENSAITYSESLCYANSLDDMFRRFSVKEAPQKKKKEDGDRMDAVYGAMYGDVIGSIYKGNGTSNINSAVNDPYNHDPEKPPCLLTGNSVLTIATYQMLKPEKMRKLELCERAITFDDLDMQEYNNYPVEQNPFVTAYKGITRSYPGFVYGSDFLGWALGHDKLPYGSESNLSAARVSPVGAFGDGVRSVIKYAAISAMATHNHIEGVKGAVVTAVCIWMARNGYSKEQIYKYMRKHYSYGKSADMFTEFNYEEVQQIQSRHSQCAFSVPAAIISFCESKDFMDAIRLSVCASTDTDTNACICGGIAGAYYGMPDNARQVVITKLQEKGFRV